MDSEKNAFIEMILEENVLKWGEFTLKSGRVSPYFFNAGLLYKGSVLKKTGEFYSNILRTQTRIPIKHLFGPAYKGLPLATATAIALADSKIDVEVTFNRKEAKSHGEGGVLMGAPLHAKEVIMIDDVITAGTAYRESKALIEAAGGELKAVIVALDRQEKGSGETSTIEEIRSEGIEVFSIITLSDLMDYLKTQAQADQFEQLVKYKERYGY